MSYAYASGTTRDLNHNIVYWEYLIVFVSIKVINNNEKLFTENQVCIITALIISTIIILRNKICNLFVIKIVKERNIQYHNRLL